MHLFIFSNENQYHCNWTGVPCSDDESDDAVISGEVCDGRANEECLGERMGDSLYGIRRPERSPRKAGQKRSPGGTAAHHLHSPLPPPFSLPLSLLSRSTPPVGLLAARVPFFYSRPSATTSHPCSCLFASINRNAFDPEFCLLAGHPAR